MRDKLATLNTVKRTANNVLATCVSFHYDSNIVNRRYKFEVHYLGGQGSLSHRSVAVVLVEANATSAADFRTALGTAPGDEHLWQVS